MAKKKTMIELHRVDVEEYQQMEKLPVKLLTELLTPEEIIAANRVKILAEAPFCPVAVSLPEEGCGGKWNYDARLSPRANFAIRGTRRQGYDIRDAFSDGTVVAGQHPFVISHA